MNNEVAPINKLLIELFQVIPRKMKNVNDYLFMGGPILDTKEELAEAQKLISKEQDTLDVMAGQVSTNSKLDIKNSKPNEKNILESMGLIIEEAPQSDIPIILDLMGQNKNQFVKAFIVNNLKTQKLFDKNILNAQNKTVDVFWHGSRNENWWSILDTGWKLRPSNAIINGKMFGHGIYWANKFQKSLGYTSYRGSYWARGSSDRAYLSLAAVHIGDQLKIKRHESWCYDLNWNNLRKRGNYDSLYALGGADLRNDEFIVYQEPQCTIKYLIEVK
jgi:poly [ADP-ribose] polymerase